MSVPFQCLCRLGQSSILCAAKGTSIHTFGLGAGSSHLSSWTHPLTKQDGTSDPQATSQDGNLNEQDSEQPPSKKRRLNSDEKPNEEGKANQGETGAVEAPESGNGKKKNKKQKPESRAQPSELPFVILLRATEDGSHLVAVTGQDKTLWVLEHDGNGVLKELSRRVMPKRPSAISITADGESILSADKFGDVYALPLIPSAAPEAADTPPTPSDAPATTTATSASKPAASRFTVHSKRNIRALEEQERMIASGKVVPKENPKFEHEPILGHVSMLTALATASSADGRPYIITADRDEHIRVSRGALPQAHVVERFCLGHGSFLNALCVPASRPEVLVSGGGDDELFLWDWMAGRLVGKADVLGRIRKVVPDASKVAVSHIYSYDAEERCYVVVICELVPAIFIFQLQQDTLEHAQTLDLAGNPLDATVVAKTEGSLRLAVAVDPLQSAESVAEAQGSAQSLLLFERDEAGSWVRPEGVPDVASEDLGLTREELENILYPVEKLRKTEFEDDAEGGGSARDSVAP
ncbi:hypothetical protein F4820DRAFT_441623 [Hypoxylon rubiginosum]|uniref:Uncharacterized protein n=1 Tax=Hypoxylon rubiginosum TaxID=110542 RepID=A0ACB9YI19_9PEZI|nr:hypothetical protein F4820DRAFT_441623 [Hypoxylon rubiginosum]